MNRSTFVVRSGHVALVTCFMGSDEFACIEGMPPCDFFIRSGDLASPGGKATAVIAAFAFAVTFMAGVITAVFMVTALDFAVVLTAALITMEAPGIANTDPTGHLRNLLLAAMSETTTANNGYQDTTRESRRYHMYLSQTSPNNS